MLFQASCGKTHLMKDTPGQAQRVATAPSGASGFGQGALHHNRCVHCCLPKEKTTYSMLVC